MDDTAALSEAASARHEETASEHPLASERPRSEARIAVQPSSVSSGETLLLHGTGWRSVRQNDRRIALNAFVPGLSPYGAIAIGSVRARNNGSFTVRWRAPRVDERFVWRIEATQKRGDSAIRRYVSVVIG